MNWVIDKEPGKGPTVKVIIQLQPGETLAEAVERTRSEFRRVTIGFLDDDEGMDRGGRLADGGQAGRLGTAPETMGGGKRCD